MVRTSSSSSNTPKQRGIPVKPLSPVLLAVIGVVVVGLALLLSARYGNALLKKENAVNESRSVASIQSDKDYLRAMILLYQEAIENSRFVVNNTELTELKTFAQGIQDNQTKSLWKMIGWSQNEYGEKFPSMNGYTKVMPDVSTINENVERAYIQGMLDHHRTVIERSKDIVNNTEHDAIKEFARQEIEDKEEELRTLNALLAKL